MQGFRAFKVIYGDGEVFLAAPAHGYGEANLDYPNGEAICGKGHRAPWPDCGCGYNAYSEPGGAVEYGASGIMADVWGHGKVDRYDVGFRSRRMRVMAFYQPYCSRCTRKAAEVATVNPEAGWLKPVGFFCEACAGDFVAAAIRVVKVDTVMAQLASKYGAGLYDAETTLERLTAWPDFLRQRDAAVAKADAVRQARASDNLRRYQAKRDARGAQMAAF